MLLLRPEVQRIVAVQAGNHVRLRVKRIDPRLRATEEIAGGLPQVLNGAAHLDLVEHPAVQHGGPLEVVDRLFRQFVAKVLGGALLTSATSPTPVFGFQIVRKLKLFDGVSW